MQDWQELDSLQDNAGVLIFPPLLLALCAGAGALTWWAVPSTIMPASISYPMAGLCTAAGLFLDRWAQGSLRRAGTGVHPSDSTSVVVSSGAFAISRNPIYLAQGLLLAAGGFLLRSVAYFWVLLPWFTVMRIGVIAREERYLLRKFGSPYADYLKTVRRWL
jgi:protein-S-isoprenylcysteine O-methyltransferase Ste14